jgi:4-amino-4-deoxy-L-arabinose transferase-like glycosyltransferase
MISEYFIKNKYSIGILTMVIAIVVYKLPFLTLPYYWDEAWPYSAAVHTLYNHGLSFLPTAVPAFVSRGHPLMFHFLVALWMNLFDTGVLAGHSFALFISVLTVVSVYLFGKRFFSERVGFIASLLFASQAIFISQSAFLMPEMLMALWTMVSFYTYFANQKFLFAISTAAMLLTKESGGVLIVAMGFSALLQFIYSKEKLVISLLRQWALIACPVLIASIYFIAQKILYGWFLFPFYTGYISAHWIDSKENLPSAFAYMFIYYGRNGISLFVILSAIIIGIKRQSKYAETERRILPALALFVVFYLLFSSVNYYIPRYLLCAFPPFIMVAVVLLDRAFAGLKAIYPLVILGICVTCIFFYFNQGPSGDNDYRSHVKTDLAMVNYCESEHLNDKKIYAPSVLRIDLSEPYAGYLSGRPFTNLQAAIDDGTEYCIFTQEEDDEATTKSIKQRYHLVPLKSFKERFARCELYQVIR